MHPLLTASLVWLHLYTLCRLWYATGPCDLVGEQEKKILVCSMPKQKTRTREKEPKMQ